MSRGKTNTNNLSHPSPWRGQYVIRSFHAIRIAGSLSAPLSRPTGLLGLAEGDETTKSKFAKRTWNVIWNQQINFLVRSIDPAAEARTHRKKRDVCATLRERTQPLGTKPECVLESIVSQSARLSRIGCVGEYLYGAPVLVPAALPWLGPEREGRKGLPYGAADEGTGWRCLLCVCPGPDHRGSHTSQKGATCAPPRGSVNGFRERSENVGG